MRITVDANVLIRVVMEDDLAQAAAAKAILREAESIAIPIPAICEVVWVLERVYRKTSTEIAAVLRLLLSDPKVDSDVRAIHAGLALLDAGGGFADGVIAHEGRRLGGEILVTFDRKAARLISEQDGSTYLLQPI